MHLKFFDKENIGLIAVTELKHIMTTLGDQFEEEVDVMLRETDNDADDILIMKNLLELCYQDKNIIFLLEYFLS